jgi:anti-anti-sigma factor
MTDLTNPQPPRVHLSGAGGHLIVERVEATSVALVAEGVFDSDAARQARRRIHELEQTGLRVVIHPGRTAKATCLDATDVLGRAARACSATSHRETILIVDPLNIGASIPGLTRARHMPARTTEWPDEELPGRFDIEVISDRVVGLSATGGFDAHSAAGMASRLDSLANLGFSRTKIDCSEITFIDVSGVRPILAIASRMRQFGNTLWLLDPSPATARLLLACHSAHSKRRATRTA